MWPHSHYHFNIFHYHTVQDCFLLTNPSPFSFSIFLDVHLIFYYFGKLGYDLQQERMPYRSRLEGSPQLEQDIQTHKSRSIEPRSYRGQHNRLHDLLVVLPVGLRATNKQVESSLLLRRVVFSLVGLGGVFRRGDA